MNNKTDYQLVALIRKIEGSPKSHMSAKVRAEVEANLAALYAEAERRGLSVW